MKAKNNLKYKHIIWDYNGTILDDVQVCLDVLNEMLAMQNKPPHTLESYKNIFCFPIRDYYALAGFDFNEISFEELAVYFYPMYTPRVPECTTRKGIEDVFAQVKKIGVKQSILTAAKENEVRKQLLDLKIHHYFEFISGLDDEYADSKVHLIPNHIKQIESITKDIRIDEILFVGDTDHDAEVAEKIGCDCVLLTNGHQSVDVLKKTGYKVIDDTNKLIEFIKKS